MTTPRASRTSNDSEPTFTASSRSCSPIMAPSGWCGLMEPGTGKSGPRMTAKHWKITHGHSNPASSSTTAPATSHPRENSTLKWRMHTATSSPEITFPRKGRCHPPGCPGLIGRPARQCNCRTTGGITGSLGSELSTICSGN